MRGGEVHRIRSQIADGLFGSCSRQIALRLSSEGGGRLRSLEGLELGRLDLERLLSLEAKFAKEGLTFDDVLLVPDESAVLPNDVSTRTRFTRGISIEVPVLSAAMDTVTEAPMAIASRARAGSASSTGTSRSPSRSPRSTG